MPKIPEGILQLKIPIPHNPLGFTNIYLVGTRRRVLIDAGFDTPEGFDDLQRQLQEAGVRPSDVVRIIVTHGHGDHAGLAGKVSRLTGAGVSMHRLEARRPERPFSGGDSAMSNSELAHGAWDHSEWDRSSGLPVGSDPPFPHHPPAGRHPGHDWVEPQVFLDDGDLIEGGDFALRVIWTPGHSPGLICLYDESRKVLFSADHVLPVTTPNIGLRPGSSRDHSPLSDYLKSLEKVKGLDASLVLPAHEYPFEDLAGRVDKIARHHAHRNAEIMDALKDGAKTAYQVSGSVTWLPDSGGVKFHSLSKWDQRMAVSETLAHLLALYHDRKIEITEKEGVVYYQVRHQA